MVYPLTVRKSVELWDRIHAERIDMLCQVALCLVLCRYQHRCSRHAHWEQPGGSLMFKLPYLSELMRYMLSARPDMCTAGSLQDPENGLLMKKGMHILTSSKTMYDLLDPLRCQGDHCHQPIEGNNQSAWPGNSEIHVLREVSTEVCTNDCQMHHQKEVSQRKAGRNSGRSCISSLGSMVHRMQCTRRGNPEGRNVPNCRSPDKPKQGLPTDHSALLPP